MTVAELFERAIRSGIAADPRGRDGVVAALRRERKQYDGLGRHDRDVFDEERLTNPYADSRLLTGDAAKTVKRMLVGIDIHPAEVLLSAELERRGQPIDLIVAHHPEGKGLAALDQVMDLQTDVFAEQGVPINIAHALMRKRMGQVARGLSPENHHQSVDAAALLGYTFLCLHTPADNRAWRFMQQLLDRHAAETVAEVVEAIQQVPEYEQAALRGTPVQVVVGSPDSRTGKTVALEFTGGTNFGKEMYEHLARAGVGTIISMHMREEHRDEAEKNHINVIIAPHMASDSLGMNLLLDEFSQAGIEVVPCSGFIRVERKRRGRKPRSK